MGGYGGAGVAEVFDCRVGKKKKQVCALLHLNEIIHTFYSPDKINLLEAEFTMDLN